MRFSQNNVTLAAAFALAATLVLGPAKAIAGSPATAVVPTSIIYPGETVNYERVQVVEVTNPNLVGEYAHTAEEVVGMIARSTLLPGRTISPAALRVPFAMTRGSTVRLTFSIGNMTISAAGSPLTDAAVGDVIRARNLDSGVIVSGTVMADGTIHVVAK